MTQWWSVRLWGAHLVGLLCVGIAVGLGFWQYDAFTERRAAEQVDLTTADPVPITDVYGPDEGFQADGLGRPVIIRGTYLDDGTVLISGRPGDDGRDGNWLVTPLTVGGPTDPAVPVVRGWVPEATDLADLPAPPSGESEVLGWLQPSEVGTEVDDDPSDRVLPDLRVADLVQLLGPGQDLYDGYAVAQEPSADDAAAGVEAASLDQLPRASRFTGLRNLLYGIEWWVFAAFAAFLWWRYVRDATAEGTPEESEDEDVDDDAVGSTA